MLDGVEATAPETVAVGAAHGRVLASRSPHSSPSRRLIRRRHGRLRRTRRRHGRNLPATLTVVGRPPPAIPIRGRIQAGEAVRIFTGAPVPDGADAMVIQENTVRDGDKRDGARRHSRGGAHPVHGHGLSRRRHAAGAGRRLGRVKSLSPPPWATGGLAVHRQPRVAILSTGDELVLREAGRARPDRCIQPLVHGGIGANCRCSRSTARHRPRHARGPGAPDRRGRRRRHPGDHRRRLGRRSRPRRAGAGRSAGWRWRSGRSPCGPASR